MARRITLITHEISHKDDRASDHLARLGYELDWKAPFNGDVLGEVTSNVAGTIIYGGGKNVSDIPGLPFMPDEIRWIKTCMQKNLPVLGICLGAQLIAHILGAEVGPHPDGWQEFGYYPIEPTAEGRNFLPETLYMTQSHSHQFQIPKGARRLAKSPDRKSVV